jgi:hypothetical protein
VLNAGTVQSPVLRSVVVVNVAGNPGGMRMWDVRTRWIAKMRKGGKMTTTHRFARNGAQGEG